MDIFFAFFCCFSLISTSFVYFAQFCIFFWKILAKNSFRQLQTIPKTGQSRPIWSVDNLTTRVYKKRTRITLSGPKINLLFLENTSYAQWLTVSCIGHDNTCLSRTCMNYLTISNVNCHMSRITYDITRNRIVNTSDIITRTSL